MYGSDVLLMFFFSIAMIFWFGMHMEPLSFVYVPTIYTEILFDFTKKQKHNFIDNFHYRNLV